jgi:hypothetical protein
MQLLLTKVTCGRSLLRGGGLSRPCEVPLRTVQEFKFVAPFGPGCSLRCIICTGEILDFSIYKKTCSGIEQVNNTVTGKFIHHLANNLLIRFISAVLFLDFHETHLDFLPDRINASSKESATF